MKHILTFLLLSLCWTEVALAQRTTSAAKSVAGCYELKPVKWKPALEDDQHDLFFPSRLRLGIEQMNGRTAMTVKSEPQRKEREMQERIWFWALAHGDLRLSLGGPFGGYRGTLKSVKDGQYSGNLKEWCDHHCGYKRTTVGVILSRSSCSE